jgi:hypothetical protein
MMMRRGLLILTVLFCATTMFAQELSNIQIHGFATQGFLYSSSNNYLSTNSSSGSLAWTDGVLSLSDQVTDNLRIGIQLHMSQLGEFGGPYPKVDFASGDYRVNARARFSVGKVKTVAGLYNDTQDIDAVNLWALLPQGVYPVANESFNLAHYGADFYGEISREQLGTLSYRGYAGYRTLDLDSGYVQGINALLPSIQQSFGLSSALITNAPSGEVFGGDVRWQTPLKGLLVGSSATAEDLQGSAGGISFRAARNVVTQEYTKFERGKFMAGFEIKRMPVAFLLTANTSQGSVTVPDPIDWRSWYVMTSYRVLAKLQVGTYYSHIVDAGGGENTSLSTNYSKDWAITGRYDFNSHFYAKLEDHFEHGTDVGFYSNTNLSGLKPRCNILAARAGLTF